MLSDFALPSDLAGAPLLSAVDAGGRARPAAAFALCPSANVDARLSPYCQELLP